MTATPNLLNYPDDPSGQYLWSFDHSNDHVALAVGTGLPSAFNLANWMLDPILGADIAAGNWNTDHQGSHDDLASFYGEEPSLMLFPGQPGDPSWTFDNFWEHVFLNQAMTQRRAL